MALDRSDDPVSSAALTAATVMALSSGRPQAKTATNHQ
jgi:hypothetical protein